MPLLIMCLTAIDQYFALIRWLSVIEQLNRSVQLLDRVDNAAFAEQQKAMLRADNDRQLAERSVLREPFGLHE
jgi:hypothetical protein